MNTPKLTGEKLGIVESRLSKLRDDMLKYSFQFVTIKAISVRIVIIVICCKPSTRTCIFKRNPKSTKTNFFQNLLKPNKTENAYFVNKIICLLKLLSFLFTHSHEF